LRRALLHLAWRLGVGRARALVRRAGWGGAALVGFFLLLILPALFGEGATAARRPDPVLLRAVVQGAALLLLVMMVVSGRALHFTGAELQFLFPAPLSRRALIAYHLATRLPPHLFTGVLFALMTWRQGGTAAGVFLALPLFMIYAQIVAQAAALAWAAAELGRRRFLLPALLGAAAATLAAALYRALVTAPPEASVLEATAGILSWVALPAFPFVELFLAPAGERLPWTLVCLAAIVAAYGLLLVLDGAYLERSLVASERMAERLRRARGAGGIGGFGTAVRLRGRLPGLAWLGNGAPLARRQLLELVRAPAPVWSLLLTLGVWSAIFLGRPLLEAVRRGDVHAVEWDREPWFVLAVIVLLPALWSHLPFDFRRDADRLSLLKALPLTPLAVAVGQLLAPVALLAAVQLAGIALLQAVTGLLAPLQLALLVVALPAVAWISIALDNALFLAFPYRYMPGDDGRAAFSPRMIAVGLLKLVVLVPALGAAALLGMATNALVDSAAAGLAVATAALLATGVPLTLLVARRFERFDIARDLPP
jgi:ABC-2 type transport system permease protein